MKTHANWTSRWHFRDWSPRTMLQNFTIKLTDTLYCVITPNCLRYVSYTFSTSFTLKPFTNKTRYTLKARLHMTRTICHEGHEHIHIVNIIFLWWNVWTWALCDFMCSMDWWSEEGCRAIGSQGTGGPRPEIEMTGGGFLSRPSPARVVARPVFRYFTPLGPRNFCAPPPFVPIQLCSVK